jgi:hypothetical protein
MFSMTKVGRRRCPPIDRGNVYRVCVFAFAFYSHEYPARYVDVERPYLDSIISARSHMSRPYKHSRAKPGR